MVTIPEYEKQLQQRREQLEQASSQIQQQQLNLSQQQLRGSSIPERQKILSKFSEQKGDILSTIKAGLLEQQQLEKEFQSPKQQFIDYQQALSQQDAYNLAIKLYNKGLPYTYESPMVRSYMKQLYEQQNIAENQFASKVADFQKKYPGEKLDIDWSKLKVKGAESASLGMSLDVTGYEKEIAKINKVTSSLPSIPNTSYENILTGAKVSAINSPGVLYKPSNFNLAQQPSVNNLLKPSKERSYLDYVQGTSYASLYSQGQLPALVTKAAVDAGTSFFKLVDVGRQKTLGGVASSPSQIQQGGEMLGEFGLFGFFGPSLETGTVSKKVAKQLQKEVSKNKFDKLGEFYESVRSEVVKKKAGEDQLKTLDKIYKEFFKGKEGGKENFKLLLQRLYEQGDFKGIPMDTLLKSPEKQLTFVLEVEGLPQMKYVGEVGGLFAGLNINVKGIKEVNVVPENIKETSWLIDKTTKIAKLAPAIVLLSDIKEKSKQQNKIITSLAPAISPLSIQVPRTSLNQNQPQIIKFMEGQIQIPRQTSPQIPRQTSPQIPRQPTPNPPKKPPPVKLFISSLGKEKIKSKKQNLQSFFIAEVKRKGKWIPVIKTPFLGKAKQVGIKRVKETLAASLRVRKGEQVIPLGKDTLEFRASKKNPLILVQKRGYRLSSKGEVFEIMGAKKRRRNFL